MKLHFFDKGTGACVKVIVLSHDPKPGDMPGEIVKAFPDWHRLNLFVVAVSPDATSSGFSIIREDDSICIVPERKESHLFASGWEDALHAAYCERQKGRQQSYALRGLECGGIARRESLALAAPHQTVDISVVVTCANYEEFLEECVESFCLSQAKPGEMVIVHDGCEENQFDFSHCPFPVAQDRIESGDASEVRNHGAKIAKGEYLLFMDADDKVAENFLGYLRKGFVDPRIAIAYPTVILFGNQEGERPAQQFDRDILFERNFIPVASLVSTLMFWEVGGFRTGLRTLRDWDLWQRLAKKHYIGIPCPNAQLHYRRHGRNLSTQTNDDDYHAVFSNADIAIVTAFDDKLYCLDEHIEAICDCEYDHEKLHLFLIDNSKKASVRKKLLGWLPKLHKCFASVSISRRDDLDALPRSGADRYSRQVSARMVELYRNVPHEMDCEFVWVCENDVIPEPKTLARLMRAMDKGVGAVSANVNAKPRDGESKSPGPQAWRYVSRAPVQVDFDNRIVVEGEDPIEIGTSAFSSVLIRVSAWRKAPVRCGDSVYAFDGTFGSDLHRQGYRYLFHPLAKCRHMIGKGEYV